LSVFNINAAATNKLFLEHIKPGLRTMLYQNTTVYDRFKTDKEAVMGKHGVMKLRTKTPKSARASSTSSFPTAQQGTYDEFIFYIKRGMYASLQFDGLAIACGKGKGAVMEIVRAEVDGISHYIANRMNKQYWGDGSGRLAQLDAASSNSTTVTINSPLFGQDSNEYTLAHQYLDEEMAVDIRNGTTGALEAEEVTISTITDDGDGTSTLVMSEAVTTTDDAWIFDHDTYAATEAAGTGVPMGLYGIISTSNATVGITATSAFQNINRSSNTYAQAQTWDHGSAAYTNKSLIKAIQKCERYGSIDAVICCDALWRQLYSILEGDKTMPNDPAFWGGTTGLSFYAGKKKKIPIIFDEDCPDNRLVLVDDSSIKIVSPTGAGLDWVPGDTGNILTRVQGKDEMVANLISYYNMTVNQPKANGVIYNVKHAES